MARYCSLLPVVARTSRHSSGEREAARSRQPLKTRMKESTRPGRMPLKGSLRWEPLSESRPASGGRPSYRIEREGDAGLAGLAPGSRNLSVAMRTLWRSLFSQTTLYAVLLSRLPGTPVRLPNQELRDAFSWFATETESFSHNGRCIRKRFGTRVVIEQTAATHVLHARPRSRWGPNSSPGALLNVTTC